MTTNYSNTESNIEMLY